MRTRVLLSAGAIALVAASCAQPDPQILSEAPRSASATELTSATQTSDRETQPGRFIARCATEADGGTPGMTVFTDGTQSVTDHCLSRYYIGVQPAPGALYVADEDTGTYAPSRNTELATTDYQWTPAQPRTDVGPDQELLDPLTGDRAEGDPRDGEDGETDGDPTSDGTEPDGTVPSEPITSPGGTPTTVTPTTPGGTVTTTPGTTQPTTPGADTPAGTGSSDPAPSTVPTVTELPGPQQPAPETPVTSTPGGSLGSAGSQASVAFPGSEGTAALPWLPPVRRFEVPAR